MLSVPARRTQVALATTPFLPVSGLRFSDLRAPLRQRCSRVFGSADIRQSSGFPMVEVNVLSAPLVEPPSGAPAMVQRFGEVMRQPQRRLVKLIDGSADLVEAAVDLVGELAEHARIARKGFAGGRARPLEVGSCVPLSAPYALTRLRGAGASVS